MLQHSFTRASGQAYCTTYYDEQQQWLRATWQGYVTPADGERGAGELLHLLGATHVPFLLNDNSQVAGPWFDSVDWLREVWGPQAQRLGLRFVAHVFQPHTEAEALPYLQGHQPFAALFELQFFATVEQAADWLHFCQEQHPLPSTSLA